ncbi:GvpL/GvpF family gas vesicle protein [Actinopolymorpha sp. B17G11]|uniref:GvpL/GvpF family gas vesicle protein n=1 Tax=Actinopolymorpha sp. B17G11 TaxID=3160861 RepID=UPI0032E3F203
MGDAPLTGRPPSVQEIESLVADADRRARDLVCDELARQLAQEYRAAVAQWLAARPSTAPPPQRSPPAPAAPAARAAPAAPAAPATQAAPAASAAPGELAGETAWYLYAIARKDDVAGVIADGIAGVEARRVQLVTTDDLAAVTAEVPLRGFRASGDEPDLSVEGWLNKSVRAHENVLDRVCRHATALPFRFGALYPSRDHVRRVLHARADELRCELDRLDGAAEWGVKAHATGPLADDSSAESVATGGPEAPDGTQWMRRRQAAAEARTHSRELRAEMAAQIDDALSPHARETVIRAASRQGDSAALAFDAVYLIPHSAETRFHEALDLLGSRHAEEGLRLEVTGPWPPYHFVSMRTDEPVPVEEKASGIPSRREPGDAGATKTPTRQGVVS